MDTLLRVSTEQCHAKFLLTLLFRFQQPIHFSLYSTSSAAIFLCKIRSSRADGLKYLSRGCCNQITFIRTEALMYVFMATMHQIRTRIISTIRKQPRSRPAFSTVYKSNWISELKFRIFLASANNMDGSGKLLVVAAPSLVYLPTHLQMSAYI